MLNDSSSETTAHRRVWMELRTCLRDRVKETIGFITVITLIESLTRLMNSLTRALGSRRVLCAGCWWFEGCCQSLQLMVAQHHLNDIHRQNNPAHFNNFWFCRHQIIKIVDN